MQFAIMSKSDTEPRTTSIASRQCKYSIKSTHIEAAPFSLVEIRRRAVLRKRDIDTSELVCPVDFLACPLHGVRLVLSIVASVSTFGCVPIFLLIFSA